MAFSEEHARDANETTWFIRAQRLEINAQKSYRYHTSLINRNSSDGHECLTHD